MYSTKMSVRTIADCLHNSITAIHPSWDSGECPRSKIIMDRSRKVIDKESSTLPQLLKATRDLYRLWKEFKDDYEDKDYTDLMNKIVRLALYKRP